MPSAEIVFTHFTRSSCEVETDEEEGTPKSRALNGTRVGACVQCKSLKVRCQYINGQSSCQRCKSNGLRCEPRTRKKRKPAPTHEALQNRSLEQDREIQDILQKMDNMKAEHKIRTWLHAARGSDTDGLDSDSSGDHNTFLRNFVARGSGSQVLRLNEVVQYFRGPYSPQELNLPVMVKHCRLHAREILDLFEIFFQRVNPYFSLLDPDLHTPHRLIWESPFLFTVILTIASRYYSARPELYQLATRFAQDAAGKELVEGSKSVDLVQGYLLMAVYPVPKKSWAEDRSWLLMGVAIKMAFELQLNQPPPPEMGVRESLNRTRTWLNCYCVDGSHAIQFGKMPMLSLNDYMARQSKDWYKTSDLRTPFDIHLCAYVEIIIIMSEWKRALETRSSDPAALAAMYDSRLDVMMTDWVNRYAADRLPTDPEINTYRGNTTQLITAYLRLVVLSHGFQHAVKTGLNRDTYTFIRAMEAAHNVIRIMVERLFPTGHLKYALEANFLYVAFAAAFLINFLRPKFLPLLDQAQEQHIIDVVSRLIEILRSGEVALDGRHTPALYSRFLCSLLNKHNKRPPALSRGSNSPVDDITIYPQYTVDRQQSPPQLYSWPDRQASRSFENIPHAIPVDQDTYMPGMIYQQSGEADMDFSMNHFVSAISNVSQNYPNVMDASQTPAMPAATTYWNEMYANGFGPPHQFHHNWSEPRF